MSELDESAFNHFVDIPCDKCGTVSSYSNPEEVTECFGCICKRLDEMEVKCDCGWSGKYHDQKLAFQIGGDDGDLNSRFCPMCHKKGYSE